MRDNFLDSELSALRNFEALFSTCSVSRSLGSLLNYVRLDHRKGPLELGNSLTAFAAKAFMISCNDRNALTQTRNKIYCFLKTLNVKIPEEENLETFFDKYFFKIDSSLRKALRKKHKSSDKSSKRVATQQPNTCSVRSLRSDRARAKKLGRYVATGLEPKLGHYVATELEPELDRVAIKLEPKFGRYVAIERSVAT
ncbi:hypothetical protein F2Q69_00006986 [Brassica cretica]|uniref:Uncharacterized protein n=1 Tax=Brassica cretica TaxID=69181 RepID=A0A8S9P6D8_BRACR|nr:hypothetical protein F2Q69_00006986 [Brassica cretica]